MVEVANRRFFLKTYEWRVGVSSSSYRSVGESSLKGSGWFRNPDPFIQLRVPKGATNILQKINTGDKLEGWIDVTDREGILQLLYTIDVDNGTAGTQTAILTGNDRTVIDYFVLSGYDIKIANAADSRTTPTVSDSFTNTVIRSVEYLDDEPASPVRVNFYADSVTVTVA
jgi:hypothetical protein